jgi:hypothetical protein
MNREIHERFMRLEKRVSLLEQGHGAAPLARHKQGKARRGAAWPGRARQGKANCAMTLSNYFLTEANRWNP